MGYEPELYDLIENERKFDDRVLQYISNLFDEENEETSVRKRA